MENVDVKEVSVWAILLPVLLVVVGHILGTVITDNYYFDGFTPVKKDKSKATQTI